MTKKKMKEAAWVEAKKRCRLNEADIQMAKKLGMTPKGLIKNIPAPNQQWKLPVKLWIHDLYEEKFGQILTVHPAPSKVTNEKEKKQEQHINVDDYLGPEDLPF